ncbi:MAG: RES domain-containing protein [Acidimicrobiales bacterium]
MPLREPPPPAALAALAGQLLAGRTLQRVFRAGRSSPWWFASVGDHPDSAGRFDLPAPDGACYLATTAVGAALEALQDLGQGVLPLAELRARRRAVVMAPAGAPRAARLVSARARGLGVTQALWAGSERALTQRWARALRRAGWLALWTGVQHDPTGRFRGITLFDEAGEHQPYGDEGWVWEAVPLAGDREVIDGLARYGIRVLADFDPPFRP